MRVLCASIPAYSHAAPLLSLARELRAQGHEVAWASSPELLRRLEEPPPHYPTDTGTPLPQGRRVQRRNFVRFLRDIVPRLASAMAPGLQAAVEDFRPDAMAVDLCCFAGASVAEAHGIPWVTTHMMPALYQDIFDGLVEMEIAVTTRLEEAAARHGLPAHRWPLRSPNFNFIPGPRCLLPTEAVVQSQDIFVGTMLLHRQPPLSPSMQARVEAGSCGLVSLGTLTSDMSVGVLRDGAESLATELDHVWVAAPPELFRGHALPSNVEVAPWLPTATLLPLVDAALCHGGYATVTEALAGGTPMLVSPTRYDQPWIAHRLVQRGVAIQVSRRAERAAIQQAATRLLQEPQFLASARAQAALFPSGGTAEAVAKVTRLVLG